MLWAFAVLDILTPEVMQLLADKLLSLPREAFTQEAYIQLYQAKMSLSQQVWPASPAPAFRRALALLPCWFGVLAGGRGQALEMTPPPLCGFAPSACGPSPPAALDPGTLQVYDIAQYIPPELLAQAETEWRRQSGEYKVSVTHRWVGRSSAGAGSSTRPAPEATATFLPTTRCARRALPKKTLSLGRQHRSFWLHVLQCAAPPSQGCGLCHA